MNNNYVPKENRQVDREYVEELVYENITLWDQNMRLEYENSVLRKSLEELERLKRLWSGVSSIRKEKVVVIVFIVNDSRRYNN